MRARIVLYGIFVLSGAAGLIYESVWTRYLGLFVGHNAYAQVLVITIFLGGMALGAWLVGAKSERLADPLKWYAGVEVLVGAISVFFHDIYQLVTSVAYDAVFPALAGGPLLTVVKWGIAALLILPQSVLLGTTFPLMGAGVLRRFGTQPGRVLAILYFANSLGAAVGVLLAGFYLLSMAGLPGTLLAGGMVNLVVGLTAYVLATRVPAVSADPHGAVGAGQPARPSVRPSAVSVAPLSDQLRRLLLGVAFGTAVASFMYEIAWLRMLALVLGSATHSFELMLSAFIFGLALGSFWVRTRADRWTEPLRALGTVQWIMGLTALATLPLYGAAFGWMSDLLQMFARSDHGYRGFTLARYGICLLIMLPSTFCAGITLPLITRTLMVRGAGESAIGKVYGVNTLGSITGVALAALLLLPLVGLRLTLAGGAALDMGLGVMILFAAAGGRPAVRRLAYGALGAMVGLVAVLGGPRWVDPRVQVSGVFRLGTMGDTASTELLFYRDGRTATVSVTRSRANGDVSIATNGKVDGSIPAWWDPACADTTDVRTLSGDMSTQALGPLITLAHAPGAREAAVIGLGTGMSSHFLLGSPRLERLTTIEIERAIVPGAHTLYPANRRLFDDPRSVIVLDDARAYVAAATAAPEVIFSEPSNPWVSGVASLFTVEFYRHVSRYLADDGIFGQWLHLYELNDGLALSVIAGVHATFPAYEIFLTDGLDVVIVASKRPALPAPDWSVFELPALRHDLCRIVRPTPEALEATRLIHRRALAPLLDDWGQPNSDYYPVLDLGAERARFQGQFAHGFRSLVSERFDLTAPFFRRRRPLGEGTAVALGGIARVRALALGAALRHGGPPPGVDSSAHPPQLDVARYRQTQWRAMLAAHAPGDWAVWLEQFRVVEADRNGGTAGVADEQFYDAVQAYLERYRAPDVVRAAVRFHHGLATWNFAAAAQAADELVEPTEAGEPWISADDLLEGGIVAKLQTGDVEGAEELRTRLLPKRRRPPDDLRVRLLSAYLETFAHAGAGGR